MPRVCLQYAYATPTLPLRYGYAKKGTYVRRLTNLVSLVHEPMFISHRTSGSRKALILAVLMLVGITGAWGQTDYSGTYYIASVNPSLSPQYNEDSPSTNYYLCATENWYYYQSSSPYYTNTADTNNVMPFMTTYKCRDGVNDAKARWNIIKKEGENYYYIKHISSGRYLTYNVVMEDGSNVGRMRLHLETSPADDDDVLFEIVPVANPKDNTSPCFDIKTKRAAPENTRKYMNVSGDNNNSLQGANTKKDGPNAILVGGTIGLWTNGSSSDKNSQWMLESVYCAKPQIQYDFETHKITITSETDGATIYYTLDGKDPNTESSTYNESNKPTITERTVVKAIAVKTNKENSEVATQTIVLSPVINTTESASYTGSAQKPDVNVLDVETLISSDEYEVSYSNNINAGNEAIVTITDKEGGNYIIYGSGNFTINPKALTITAEAKSKVYGDDDPALTYTSEGLVGSDVITGALSRDTGEDVGTYAINQNTLTAGSNYSISYIGTNLTITPKALTVTAKPKTITYGDVPANDGVTYSGFVGSETESVLTGELAYAYDYSQYDDAGDYNITPSGLTGDNYDITYHNGTLTVGQKEVSLIWSETTSFPYDGTSHCLTVTTTGMVNGDEIDVTVIGEQTNAGDHIATASALTGAKANNYKLPDANTREFSITKVGLIITANNNAITYGDAPAGNGVTYEGFVNSETASVLGGTLDYDYSYTQYGDVGDTYTITPKGLTSTNYAISFVAGTLTVGQKEVGITWGETRAFVYDGIAHAPTATATGLVNNDAITVIVTGAQTNVGGYTATASELTGSKVDNYKLPAANTRSFTISAKSLGDGDFPAEDITIQLTSEGELEYVKDGDIILITDNDYTYEINTEGSDKIVAVNGIGNYTGSFRGIYANPRFYDVDGEGAGKAAAVYMSSRDVNTFAGVDAYTVKSVNAFLGLLTVSKLEYIPKDVPVLLLSESEASGFVVSEKDENIADIPESTVNSNLLKMAPAAGIPVETAQAYMFYLGEFVLTKAGTITSGKFYILNPNYSDTPADPASAPVRRSLMIVEEETTDIANMLDKGSKPADDVWYTLDGRRLSSKPVNKGLYIHHGRKTIIK